MKITSPTTLKRDFIQAVSRNAPNSGFRILAAGLDGLLMRIQLIDTAEKSLDLQYYIFHSDRSGRLVENALLRAADRGVHVRILLDDGETVDGDEKLLTLSAHPNIEVRNFNPFRYRGHIKAIRALEFLVRKSRLDYRMHNKLFIADDAVALTGGRNIGDQYFQIDPESQFGDDDIVAVGPIVQELSAEFTDYWSSPEMVSAENLSPRSVSPDRFAKLRADLARPRSVDDGAVVAFAKRASSGQPIAGIISGESPLRWAKATLVYDSPDKRRLRKDDAFGGLMYAPIAARIAAANSELLMITPYLVPAPAELKLLEHERDKEVQVRLLTNSLAAAPDVVAHSGYMRHRAHLLEAGLKLYEIRPLLGDAKGSGAPQALAQDGTFALHAKLFVFDRSSLFVGSMNLDQRSYRLNTEMGLIIDSSDLAHEVVSRFDALTQPKNAYEVILRSDSPQSKSRLMWRTQVSGQIVEYSKEPARSALQRLEARLLMLIPIDSEL